MKFKFNPCPDCGSNYDEPIISRTIFRDFQDNMENSIVRACCRVCDWETHGHSNVEECADEWNSTVIYH